jgi:hypothetical protein
MQVICQKTSQKNIPSENENNILNLQDNLNIKNQFPFLDSIKNREIRFIFSVKAEANSPYSEKKTCHNGIPNFVVFHFFKVRKR